MRCDPQEQIINCRVSVGATNGRQYKTGLPGHYCFKEGRNSFLISSGEHHQQKVGHQQRACEMSAGKE